jgi:Domain of unknown function (DUF4440)
MKKISLFVCFFILCVPVFSQTEKQTKEQTVLALHVKKFDWMVQKQYDSLETVLDKELMYIHSNGWIESKDEVMADLKSGKLNYTSVKITEAKARIFKTTAVVTGKGIFNVVMENKPLEIQLMYTEVYVEKKGNWMIVSRHANKL